MVLETGEISILFRCKVGSTLDRTNLLVGVVADKTKPRSPQMSQVSPKMVQNSYSHRFDTSLLYETNPYLEKESVGRPQSVQLHIFVPTAGKRGYITS